jgi:hypothetical protein
MSLWLAARVREMSLAIARQHATQITLQLLQSRQDMYLCLSLQQRQMQKP